jgi:hypothetical protein
MDADYQATTQMMTRRQIALAGYRLAALLDALLGSFSDDGTAFVSQTTYLRGSGGRTSTY